MRITQNGDNNRNDIDNSRRTSIRVGSFDLGLGQIAVAVAVVVVGGGGAAAVVTQDDKPAVAEAAPAPEVVRAAGTWKLDGTQRAGMFRVTEGTLTISQEAVYRFGVTMAMEGMPAPASGSCGGEVTARAQTLVFTPFENSGESCRTFTAEMAGTTMTLGVGDDSVRFRRA